MIAARPKVGKSSLVAQIADFAASQVPTAIMSLEMTKNELIKLLLYQHASVDGNLEQTGKLTKYDIESIRNASLILKTKKLYIDDKARTMGAILQSVRRAKKDFLNKCAGELRVLIVDYIQFIRGDNRIKGRNYQLEDISRSLKEIAKELNLCVICLAQIGRGAEDNRDMRPMPSDLKDCAMESDVDALMLMYRDAYYKGNNDKNSVIHFVGNKKVLGNLVELNCFLNRHGPTGIIKLDFIPAYRKYIPWGAQLDLSGGDPF